MAVCSRSFFPKIPCCGLNCWKRYENVTFNDAGSQLRGNSLVAFLRGHEKAITALEVIDESVLSQLPELQVIGKYGVGLDMIDLSAIARVWQAARLDGRCQQTIRFGAGHLGRHRPCCVTYRQHTAKCSPAPGAST